MIRTWLSDQGFTLGPAIALLIFLVVFVGVLAWVFRPGSKRIYEHESRLPLDDDAGPGAGDVTTRTDRNEDREP